MKTELSVDYGKYKIIFNESPYEFKALRYGEEWRDLTGDNLIFNMFVEIQKLTNKIKDLENTDYCAKCFR